MITLTVFTSTYNRAHTIIRTYESLCRQTSKDFCWLIIDDGSTDNTKGMIEKWQQIDKGFKIDYYHKENGGLHTGYNKAIELMDSELAVCIDSDDYMPDNAVEKIIEFWKKNGGEEYAGIIGLDYTINNKPIGGMFPHIKSMSLLDMVIKYKHKGDVKMVHRTDLLKLVAPMKSFQGEKNFNPIYMFIKIDMMGKSMLVMNENLCFVEYQEAGMTNNIYKQYVNSPRSFAELRKLNMIRKAPLWFVFKNAIHYVSSCLINKDKLWLKNSPEKFITLIAFPFGLFLFVYIKYKNR